MKLLHTRSEKENNTFKRSTLLQIKMKAAKRDKRSYIDGLATEAETAALRHCMGTTFLYAWDWLMKETIRMPKSRNTVDIPRITGGPRFRWWHNSTDPTSQRYPRKDKRLGFTWIHLESRLESKLIGSKPNWWRSVPRVTRQWRSSIPTSTKLRTFHTSAARSPQMATRRKMLTVESPRSEVLLRPFETWKS